VADTMSDIVAAADEIANLYSLPNGGAGGNAHIVLDDYNVDDESISWCLQNIGAIMPGADEDRSIAEHSSLVLQKLMRLSERDRWYAIRLSGDEKTREAIGRFLSKNREMPSGADCEG
jgi:hypothetical protein